LRVCSRFFFRGIFFLARFFFFRYRTRAQSWQAFNEARTLKSYWHSHANKSQVNMKTLLTYTHGAAEMLETYMAQFQRYVEEGKPAILFELFINRFMITDYLRKEDFAECVLSSGKNRTFLPRSVVESLLVGDGDGDGAAAAANAVKLAATNAPQSESWASHMHVCAITHRAMLIKALGKLLQAKAQLNDGMDPFVVYLEDAIHIDKHSLGKLQINSTPLIVQTDPLKFDVVCRGILYDCGYDMRRALLVWLMLIYERFGGVIRMGDRSYNVSPIVEEHVLPLYRYACNKERPDAQPHPLDEFHASLFRVGSTAYLAGQKSKRREEHLAEQQRRRAKAGADGKGIMGNPGLSGLTFDFYGIKRRKEQRDASNQLKGGDLMSDDNGPREKAEAGKVTKLDAAVDDRNKSGVDAAAAAEEDGFGVHKDAATDAYEQIMSAEEFGREDYTINVIDLVDSGKFNGTMAERLRNVFGDRNKHLRFEGSFSRSGSKDQQGDNGDAARDEDGASDADDGQQQRIQQLAKSYGSRAHYYDGGSGSLLWNPAMGTEDVNLRRAHPQQQETGGEARTKRTRVEESVSSDSDAHSGRMARGDFDDATSQTDSMADSRPSEQESDYERFSRRKGNSRHAAAGPAQPLSRPRMTVDPFDNQPQIVFNPADDDEDEVNAMIQQLKF
jgi:hypothetical protein